MATDPNLLNKKQWQKWRTTPEALVEILRNPQLGLPPKDRPLSKLKAMLKAVVEERKMK